MKTQEIIEQLKKMPDFKGVKVEGTYCGKEGTFRRFKRLPGGRLSFSFTTEALNPAGLPNGSDGIREEQTRYFEFKRIL